MKWFAALACKHNLREESLLPVVCPGRDRADPVIRLSGQLTSGRCLFLGSLVIIVQRFFVFLGQRSVAVERWRPCRVLSNGLEMYPDLSSVSNLQSV